VRILVVNTYRSVVGGVETYLRAVLRRLRAAGHELGLLTEHPAPPGPGDVLDGVEGVAAWTTAGTDPAAVLGQLSAWRPGVVYYHGATAPAVDAALADRFTVVSFAHNYDGTCVSGTKCHAFPGWQPCSRPLGPGCLGLYFPRRCGGLNPVTMVSRYRENRRRQALLRGHHRVLVASRHMAAEVVRNGVPPERVVVVPLFPPEVRPDPEPPAPRPRAGRLLFVGRVTALKGWRELLDAVPRAAAELGHRLTLVVAGEGPDRPAFEAEARRRAVPAEFLGWVGAERCAAEMRAADVLAVPSVWPEPFGLVGIEAGCVGLPGAAFAVGGIPDWLTPGVSGELAPGERPDPREFAAALVRVLADDAGWQRLRVGAWEAARRFTPEAHLDRLIPILKAAAGHPARSDV
jgi:glycosyltransferase involved in cell wall biosynthesis